MALGALVVLIVGVLVVNYFKDKKAETLPALTNQAVSTKEHIVVKGETLWSIAEDAFGSGYNWVDIKSANNLPNDKIEIGQKLTIPEAEIKKPTVTENTISRDSYTVQKGDSLWKIAVKEYGNGYKWTTIAKANNIQNPNLIYSGNVLKLPR